MSQNSVQAGTAEAMVDRLDDAKTILEGVAQDAPTPTAVDLYDICVKLDRVVDELRDLAEGAR